MKRAILRVILPTGATISGVCLGYEEDQYLNINGSDNKDYRADQNQEKSRRARR